jgi:putative hydrolase of the HAD superfamily
LFKNKTHIFFDLDHTLWDYNRNCEEALTEMFDLFNLKQLGIENTSLLIDKFHLVNHRLWNLYDSHQISSFDLRFRRFREVFDEFGIKNKDICDNLHDSYMEISPNKPHLFSGAIEILEYLKPKYSLHIITNGIADNQDKKMVASGIKNYFESVICSQKANARKPEKAIFEFALKSSQAAAYQSLMIGDNYEVDIIGAENAGIDTILFSPEKITFSKTRLTIINHLLDLKDFI